MDYNIFFRGQGGTVVNRAGNIIAQGMRTTYGNRGGVVEPKVTNVANCVCEWLPAETNQRLWTTLLGLTGAAICYAGYRAWKWIDEFCKEQRRITEEHNNRYEYKYLDKLDNLLQSTLDDVENPELSEVDTIKVGGSLMPMVVFKSFTRNMRKRMIRKAETAPVVKRVTVPAEEFDWEGSYVVDMVPVGTSRDPADGKTVVMRYHPETDSFWWYCDNPSVQYRYLETVARKYACDFNRVDVFVDIRDELKKAEAEVLKKDDLATGDGGDAEDGSVVHESDVNKKKVYAKFKRYNKKAARADPSAGGGKVVLKAKSNRYTYKGKLDDYEKIVGENKDEDVVIEDGHGEGVSCGSSKKKRAESVSWSEWKISSFHNWN
jgi:hypothetical protein